MKTWNPHLLLVIITFTLLACTTLPAPSEQTPVETPAGDSAPTDTTPVADATGTPQSEAPLEEPTEAAVEEPTGENLAAVDSIEVRILESDPVQVEVVARGNLADGCTELDEPMVMRDGTQFGVMLTTQRPADAICTQALVPFEQVIALDVTDVEPGDYTVDVNGVIETFTLGS